MGALVATVPTSYDWFFPVLSALTDIVRYLRICGTPAHYGSQPDRTARHENHVPWAWGINGCLSVVSAAIATILAVEFGFSAVMIAAVSAYTVAMNSVPRV